MLIIKQIKWRLKKKGFSLQIKKLLQKLNNKLHKIVKKMAVFFIYKKQM